jgi:hypothetical protein
MTRLVAALLFASLSGVVTPGAGASDKDLIPAQLPREQRENLLRFLQQHEKPDRFLPRDAKLVGSQPVPLDTSADLPAGEPIKQYTVQIISHRPVPGQEQVKSVDVYYYRPNPEKGKPGITVRHTVDLATGNQVGQTEVLLNHHTPLSREEVAEAVALAREQSAAIQGLYTPANKDKVHWEYLQLVVRRKHEALEPGDRVLRLVFNAPAAAPVRVYVDLTKGIVVPESH